MHEMSVAIEVCRMAQERLGDDVSQLIGVGLQVGCDSGLEPANLEFCLEALLAQPPFRGARPVIELQTGDALWLAFLEIDDERSHD